MNYFDELIGNILYKDVKTVRKNLNDVFAELSDGTTYEVRSASNNSRGCKCDRAYVDSNIGKDILDCIVYPCLFMSSLPRDEQVIYF